ncbi:MAG TPA: hypothetical protein VG405_00195 [Solirubrobacteraceae bacterium]|jgi:hypothetical protein|nr:hypothetical protein [Solirubrobacteraceae bacterium]
MSAGGVNIPNRVGIRLRPALGTLAAASVMLTCAAPASAHRFPIPRCGWVSKSRVQRTFGVQVKARKPYWATKIAPVLHCNFTERQSGLQVPGQPIVRVQFRELQRLEPQSGFVPVEHLGNCRRRVSCTKGKSAWLYTQQAYSSLSPTPFTASVSLGVEAGLNSIVIQVANPFGPLPVANEVTAAEHLAKKLARRFRWK